MSARVRSCGTLPRRALAAGVAILCGGAPVRGEVPERRETPTVFADAERPSAEPAAPSSVLVPGPAAEADRETQRLAFHGWSPDSRYIAYTRYHPPGRRPEGAGDDSPDADGWTLQRMHRKVSDGDLKGFGRMVGKDVAAHAAAAGYVVRPMPREAVGEGVFHFAGDPPMTLEIEVGRQLGFHVKRGARTIFRHVFDRLYVAFEPSIYPSPNGCQALLVFHLDTGWEVDAAIFTFPLVRKCI
jgi:hypothetical protein